MATAKKEEPKKLSPKELEEHRKAMNSAKMDGLDEDADFASDGLGLEEDDFRDILGENDDDDDDDF